MARIKSWRMGLSFAEPHALTAQTEADRTARGASNRFAVEWLERALRAAEQDAAGFALQEAVRPPERRPVA